MQEAFCSGGVAQIPLHALCHSHHMSAKLSLLATDPCSYVPPTRPTAAELIIRDSFLDVWKKPFFCQESGQTPEQISGEVTKPWRCSMCPSSPRHSVELLPPVNMGKSAHSRADTLQMTQTSGWPHEQTDSQQPSLTRLSLTKREPRQVCPNACFTQSLLPKLSLVWADQSLQLNKNITTG